MPRPVPPAGIAAALLILVLSFPGALMAESSPKVALETTHGRIVLQLDAEAAPETVANFLQYVDDGFYDGTLFHRVIPGFMVQGGGMDKDMRQKPTRDPIRNEADNGLKNKVGAVSMARTQDPHSAPAQFFVNVNDNDFLNHTAPNPQGWGYTVFGEVVEGMDVVRTIEGVPTGRSGMHQDVPQEPVVLESARRAD